MSRSSRRKKLQNVNPQVNSLTLFFRAAINICQTWFSYPVAEAPSKAAQPNPSSFFKPEAIEEDTGFDQTLVEFLISQKERADAQDKLAELNQNLQQLDERSEKLETLMQQYFAPR